MSRSNSVSSQHHHNNNTVNTSSGHGGGVMSIHLGNYIISVPKDYAQQITEERTSPVKRSSHMKTRSGQGIKDRSHSPAVTISTSEVNQSGQSAIKFELSWIKFIKDAEDEYNRRLSRNDKPQQLSIFEVNQDLFELYLLKVSGRALAKIQYLNFDLKSSLCADMKLFDNQSGVMPPQRILIADQMAEIENRRHRRLVRRERKRRETAHFATQSHEIEAVVIEEELKIYISEEDQAELSHQFSIIDAQPPQPSQIIEEAPLQIQLAPVQIQMDQPASPEKIPEPQVVEEVKEPIQQQDQKEDFIPEQQLPLETATPPKPKKKKVLLDSLNDRSDDEEDGEGRSSPGSPILETEDEFDRDDMGHSADNVQPTQIFNQNGLQQTTEMDATVNLLAVGTPEVASPDFMTPENNNTLNDVQQLQNAYHPNHHFDSAIGENKLEISIDDQSQEQKSIQIEQVKDETYQKIKIGDMTIEDPYMSINDEGVMMQLEAQSQEGININGDQVLSANCGEHYTLNEVSDPMFDNSNPFREKSVISYINSPNKSQHKIISIEENESNNIENQSHQKFSDEQAAFGPSQSVPSKEESLTQVKEDTEPVISGTNEMQENSLNINEKSQSNTAVHIQQQNSLHSLEVIEKTNSLQDLQHHISYENGEHQVIQCDQSLSAITSGRKVHGNLSAFNTVRVEEEDQPEREVILRFEVAVGTTPLNLTFDEGSAFIDQHNQKMDAALGSNTPLDRTGEQMRADIPEMVHPTKNDVAAGTSQIEPTQKDASIMMSQKSANDIGLSAHIMSDNSRGQSKLQPPRRDDSPQPKSLEASNEKKSRSPTPSRLEVTLTAEPDKPIMVEVRGGEKQFLISALTKHIYDILSQPNRLHIYQDENGTVKFGDSEDPNAPGQHLEPVFDSSGKGAFQLGNQNINLKLKSVKKDMDSSLPILQNLGGKNAQNKTGRTELNNDTLQNVKEEQQNAKLSCKSQKLDQEKIPAVQSSFNGPISVVNEPDNCYSLPEVTASARDNSGFIKLNQAPQNNGRPSILSENVMPLTPHSVSLESNLPSPPQPVQKVQDDIITFQKRTTVLANTEGKINEEQSQGSFDEEIPIAQSIQESLHQTNSHKSIPNHDRNSTEGSFRKVNPNAIQGMMKNGQENLRSRPETANFNKAYAAVASDNINPFIQQEEDEGTQVNQPQLETPKRQEEEEIDVSVADQKSRLETPHADILDGAPYSNLQNSVPSEMEDYIKQPLHPTIPEQHPNGYFSNESDYMMVMPPDGNSLGNGVSSHSNDQYLTPKLAFFDQYPSSAGQNPPINLPTTQQIQQQLMRHQSINDFYSSQYGYSDADQNVEDFILAEGYPLLNFVQDGCGRNSLNSLKTEIQSNHQSKKHLLQLNRTNNRQQLFDFNGQSYSHQNTTNPTLETPPNAYRIRKVILPNYPNATYTLQQSEVENQKQSPLSQPLRPLLNNTLQPNDSNAGALLRKQKTMQSSQKLLPVVKTKKRIFNNTINNTTIYSVNGGPAHRSLPMSHSHSHTRSLSPLRKKNHIFYTSNFIISQKKILQQLQHMNAQTQASTMNNGSTNNTMGHLTVDDFAQFGYYSQSPQPRLRNSPYLSDDEYKILHDYYDIQCEPTGLQRKGVPLMKVKRVQRPKNRTFNIFNFPDDPTTNVQLPKALTSLQIFYPQFQPSQAEYMARTLASPSKWFDRFNQSTKNLNHTINNLHNQHTHHDNTSNILRARCGSQNSLFLKKNHAKERSAALIERNRINRLNKSQSPDITMNNNISNELSRSGGVLLDSKLKNKKKLNNWSGQDSGGTNSSTTFMPPLHKIYTASLGQGGINNLQNSMNNHDSSQEKGKLAKKSGGQNGKTLPPRPGNNNKKGSHGSKMGVNMHGGEIQNNITATTSTSEGPGGTYQSGKNMIVPAGQGPNIINTNHNQYVCFGVNIITKSDK